MIFDCFLYNGELECLNIRMNELQDLDVCHVIVQANKTFTGKDKDILYFIHGKEDKDKYIYVTDMPEGDDCWEREKYQRNAIMRGLTDAKDDDLIIISDADEIVFAHSVLEYTPEMGVAAFVMNKTGYWLNCVEGYQSWKIAKILTYKMLKESSPDEVRNAGQETLIENAGWHYSYLGGVEGIKNKLESFSHQDANTNELKSKLSYKIETGQSLWSDKPDDLWQFVPIDSSFPKYIQEHQHDSLQHLIK